LLCESVTAVILDFFYNGSGLVWPGNIIDADVRAGGPKRDGDSLANS
jgi:hypothetical protein